MELTGKALNALRNTNPTVHQCLINEWLLFKLRAVLLTALSTLGVEEK